MKNPHMILLLVTICIGLSRCYEYVDSDDSDEDYDSDEVKHGFDKEHHYPSYEGSKHGFKKEIKKTHGAGGEVEQNQGSSKWQYTEPRFDDVKPVWEKGVESTLQQDVQQVFGTGGQGQPESQDSGIQWNPPGQQPISGSGVPITDGGAVRVNEQLSPAIFPGLDQESNGGQNNGVFPSLNARMPGRNQQQRFRRQAPTENQGDLIEIDGANVKFNLDQGTMAGIIAKHQDQEDRNVMIGGKPIINNEQGSTWATTEPPLPQQEVQTGGEVQQESSLPNENTGLFPAFDPQVNEGFEGCTTCAASINQENVQPSASVFTSSQEPPAGETKEQETVLPAISLINDDSVTSLTEKNLVPLKIGSADGGLKFNQGMKTEFENGYNQGFKDGYRKGAKEGFDHGAKHGCQQIDKQDKYVYEKEKKVVESGDGQVTVENKGAVAEVEAPAVTSISEEEVKEAGGGDLAIVHTGELAHVNKPEEEHHCDKHFEEKGSVGYKIEHGEEIVQVTEAAVTPIKEEEVVQVDGGNVAVVQEDAAAEVQIPAVTLVVQEEKKEVIKTNPTHEHKYWHHGHGDDGFDFHGHYHGYHHGHDYHQGHKDSYPHNSQYHGYHHGAMDSYAHGSKDHGYYHGHHDVHHQGSKYPHYHGSKDDHHHGPEWHHWDSSSEDDCDSSEESGDKHHLKKRSTETATETIIYDLSKAPELFQKFIVDYDKKYKDDADYQKHYMNFVKNLEDINKMNAAGGSATFDINMFADLDLGNA